MILTFTDHQGRRQIFETHSFTIRQDAKVIYFDAHYNKEKEETEIVVTSTLVHDKDFRSIITIE